MPGLFEGFDVLTEKHVKTAPAKKQKQKSSSQIVLSDSINIFAGIDYETEKDKQEKEDKILKDPVKILKSKKTSIADKLYIITNNVLKVLGKQKDNIVVIRTKEDYDNYITAAIASGRIAIDTETNNSLDPVTCKLMGLCLYYPGGKQAYIPVNHRNYQTKQRLEDQLLEADIKVGLDKIKASGIKRIMHNGKFDYEVLKCTCGVEIAPDWDTMVCARLLNENERAGLKEQYVAKIDRTQAKYHIEDLFTNIAYADVDPDTFALYAATDAAMTDKLYELQAVELSKDEYGPHMDLLGVHELKGLRWLFHEVEMPIVAITAEMELTGVSVDEELGQRLKDKYNAKLLGIDGSIDKILLDLKPIIAKWKTTPAANQPVKIYAPKKSKSTAEKLEQLYPNEDENGKRYKLGKNKVSILEDPINLASPAQLAVLFYDILGVNKSADDDGEEVILDQNLEEARKTGKDELKSIKEKLANYLPKLEEIEADLVDAENGEDVEVEEAIELSNDDTVAIKLGNAAKLADMLLKRREVAKLITTYIDVIPDLAKHWPDGRIRFHMNSTGTDTGRYSSGGKWHWLDEHDNDVTVSGINVQNIPSRGDGKITRLLFKAAVTNHTVDLFNDCYSVPETDEVETTAGWKQVEDLVVGDSIIGQDNTEIIKKIIKRDTQYLLYV